MLWSFLLIGELRFVPKHYFFRAMRPKREIMIANAIPDAFFNHVPSTKVREIVAMFKAIHASEDCPLAPSGLKPSPVQNSGLKRSHCSSLTPEMGTWAAINKFLAQSNKSQAGGQSD
jgi:hypothetical protein